MFGNVNFDSAGVNNLLDWSLIQHCQLSGLMAEGDYKNGFFFICHVQRWQLTV